MMTDRQFETLVGIQMDQLRVLVELRDLILGAATADPTEGCPHPEEHRTSLATPGDPYHWYCRDCKLEYKGSTMH